MRAICLVLGIATVMSAGVALSNAKWAGGAETESQVAVAQAQQETPQSRLAAHFSYYMADQGVWRQEESKPQEGGPVAYIKRYEWGPGRAMVFDNTYAVMPDKSCRPFAHNVVIWDSKSKGVRAYIFHSAGVFGTADVELRGKQETVAELHLTLPNGAEARMRDTTDLSDPRQAVITGSAWNGQEWTTRPPVSWTRIDASQNPCALPPRTVQ